MVIVVRVDEDMRPGACVVHLDEEGIRRLRALAGLVRDANTDPTLNVYAVESWSGGEVKFVEHLGELDFAAGRETLGGDDDSPYWVAPSELEEAILAVPGYRGLDLFSVVVSDTDFEYRAHRKYDSAIVRSASLPVSMLPRQEGS